jgi:hypothetical protein
MRELRVRPGTRNVLLVGSLVFAVVAMLASGCGRETASPAASGQESALAGFLKQQQLDGRVVLMQFGMVGCELSGEGCLQMIRLDKDKAIPQLSYVRMDGTPGKEQAEAYFKEHPAGFKVAHDDGTLAKALEATVVPTVVLVDKFARVRYRGKFPEEGKLREWVQALNEEEKDAGPDVALLGVEPVDTAAALRETKLPDLTDAVKPLGSYMGTKGIVVIFADTRCPFAGAALGELPQVAPKLADVGVATVVVNLGDGREVVRKTYEKRQTGTPVLYDVADGTKKNWQIGSVPTVVLMGPDGKQVYRGGAVWKNLTAAIEKSQGLAAGSVVIDAEGTGMG